MIEPVGLAAEGPAGAAATSPDEVAAVSVRGIEKRFGQTVALAGISLDVRSGGFVSILGPSGCGKTTLMRIIAGLERQDAGSVVIDGADVSTAAPHKRPVNLVFQRYALFPHKTVAENIAFPLRLRRERGDGVTRKVEDMLALVRLPGYGDRAITQLSGGQAQRVALARALVTDPPVLLLDEPLTALDLKLRQAMQVELREIQRRVGSTFIYVTHDQTEALVMSDLVVLMDQGRVVQVGAPRDVYDRPTALFSATFLGEANLLRGRVQAGRREVRCAGVTFVLRDEIPGPATEGWICLRPEQARLAGDPLGDEVGANAVRGSVHSATFVGPSIRYSVTAGAAGTLHVETPAERASRAFAPGEQVAVTWDPAAPVFIADGQAPGGDAQ